MPPSADDDPAWIWIANLMLAAIVVVAAVGVLVWLANMRSEAFESDGPDGTAWVLVGGIFLALMAVPVAIGGVVAVICAATRKRAAFVINILIGGLGMSAGFPLLLVAAGIAGLVLTSERRRCDRALASR